MNLTDRALHWLQDRCDRRAERRSLAATHHLDDAADLGAIAARMTVDYRVAVSHGADRTVLAGILTGIGGCDLAAARCYTAAGWDPDPQPGKPSHAEDTRLAGLLAQELGYAAAEGLDYQGPRAVEYQTEPVAGGLRAVALAYTGWIAHSHGVLGEPAEGPVSVEQRLDELLTVMLGRTGGATVETLARLTSAHRRVRVMAGAS
ncbi:MAG: hypothetical protein GEV09_12335 [Pseudonocardiaceae bacterium]|nr:hypothetical protein [Pseudonocardiaceae bacterium]